MNVAFSLFALILSGVTQVVNLIPCFKSGKMGSAERSISFF